MKTKIYMRVAKTPRGGCKVASSSKANHKPLNNGDSYSKRYYPTVNFALILNIPDSAFDKASEVVAELNLIEEKLEISTDVEYPDKEDK